MEIKKCVNGDFAVVFNGQEIKRGKKYECQQFVDEMEAKYGSLVK